MAGMEGKPMSNDPSESLMEKVHRLEKEHGPKPGQKVKGAFDTSVPPHGPPEKPLAQIHGVMTDAAAHDRGTPTE